MIKGEQDTIWNAIPAGLRNKIKNDYAVISKGECVYDLGQRQLMLEYFGKHNLESKFNVGDYVCIKDQTVSRRIVAISKDGLYQLNGKGSLYNETDLILFI